MLQLKRISEVLAKGLEPVPAAGSGRPLAISLLGSSGLPLATVTTPELQSKFNLTSDNVKMYSLLGMNHLSQSSGEEPNSKWTIVSLDSTLKLAISAFRDEPMYVTILYDDTVESAVAKLKLDSLCAAMSQGLAGY